MNYLDLKMQSLITDHTMLVYLHDLLSFREHHQESFETLDVYETLHELNFVTYLFGFKKSILSTMTLTTLIFIMKSHFHALPSLLQWGSILVILLVYGSAFLHGRREYLDTSYQLKLKKAGQFALKHYQYNDFVIFLDQYLSIQSSQSYIKQTNISLN